MTPKEVYEITKVTINGQEYNFAPNADGSFKLPEIDNITEDKHIVVTYTLSSNKLIINKTEKDSNGKLAGAKFKIKQIDERTLDNNTIGTMVTDETEGSYTFVQEGDSWKSNNQNVDNSTATGYMELDLQSYSGKYAVKVNAEISSQADYDVGYVLIRENSSKPSRSNEFVYISGEQSAREYRTIVEGGKKYYIHFGYYKNSSTSSGEDTFKINSVELELAESDLYENELETDSNGQIIVQIPYGKYEITEIKAPDGYVKNDDILTFNFDENSTKEINIENEKKAKVIVHHYEVGTSTKVAEDETLEGKVNEVYETEPLTDLKDWELAKDENGEYIIPKESKGSFDKEIKEIIYYYERRKVPLEVHYYIEGTNIAVPMKNGSTAQDINEEGIKGEQYTTNALDNDKISEKYELSQIPENASGVYDKEKIEVNYYYKEIERNIQVQKLDEDGITPLSGTKFKLIKDNDLYMGE